MSGDLLPLRERAIEAARRYANTDGDKRTAALRDLADLLVDIRGHFITNDGEPDWTGRTYDYRMLVNDIWRESGLPADEIPRARSAVGYHTATVLRERLDDEQLDDIGLLPTTPTERNRQQRHRAAEARRALRTGGEDEGLLRITNTETLARTIEALTVMMARIARTSDELDADEVTERVYRATRNLEAALKSAKEHEPA